MKKIIGILIIVLGILSGVAFFNAGNQFRKTGNNMKDLHSETATSLEETYTESYYREVGSMNKGLSFFSNAMGIGIIGISIGSGVKFIIDSDRK